MLISHAEGRGRWPTVSDRVLLRTKAAGGRVAAGQVVCALAFRAMDVDEIYEAIRRLTPSDRRRLVERVVHDVADGELVGPDPAAIIGMMADEPHVMDEVDRLVTRAREASRMRPTHGCGR
jgi:hypothetical protein